MNVDTVRTIDYWAGVPICFILSIIHRIKRFLGLGRQKRKDPRKILFIELSEMGSTVLAYNSMKKAKELFPTAELYFLIFKENKNSVGLLNIIPRENILTIRSKKFMKLTVDTIKLLLRFRKERFDISIDLELFSRFSTILSYLTGAPKRVGFYKYHWEGLNRGSFQTHKVAYNSYLHMSLNFIALVHALLTPPGEKPLLKQYIGHIPPAELPGIDYGETAKKELLRRLQQINPDIAKAKRIIIINPDPGEYLPIRAWPLQNYIELTNKLLTNKEYFVIIMGMASSRKTAAALTTAVDNKCCIDFTGKTTFNEMITLFNISDLLITNDSGPAHFAALTPIKIAVFFGPETPTLYAPLTKNKIIFYSHYACSPCLSAFNHRKTRCTDNQCLKTISTEYVYSAVTKFLNNDIASVTWPLKSSNVLISNNLRTTYLGRK